MNGLFFFLIFCGALVLTCLTVRELFLFVDGRQAALDQERLEVAQQAVEESGPLERRVMEAIYNCPGCQLDHICRGLGEEAYLIGNVVAEEVRRLGRQGYVNFFDDYKRTFVRGRIYYGLQTEYTLTNAGMNFLKQLREDE